MFTNVAVRTRTLFGMRGFLNEWLIFFQSHEGCADNLEKTCRCFFVFFHSRPGYVYVDIENVRNTKNIE